MDLSGDFVLVIEILLLIAGWALFQQAKSDLTARAAQVPVLSEVKALQKSVIALLEQLKLESTQVSAQLEARCAEARDLLTALDRRLEGTPAASTRVSSRRRETVAAVTSARAERAAGETESSTTADSSRYQEIYTLADGGLSAAQIAQKTGLSEGEVELILGLRTRS